VTNLKNIVFILALVSTGMVIDAANEESSTKRSIVEKLKEAYKNEVSKLPFHADTSDIEHCTEMAAEAYKNGVNKSPFHANTSDIERYKEYLCLCCSQLCCYANTPEEGKKIIQNYVHKQPKTYRGKEITEKNFDQGNAKEMTEAIEKLQNRDINDYFENRKKYNPERHCTECLNSTPCTALCATAACGPITFYSSTIVWLMRECNMSFCEALCGVIQRDPLYLGPTSCALGCTCLTCKQIANL